MKKIKFIFVLWIAKLTLLAGKILKKQGSMISGKVAVALQKDFVKYFYNIDYDKTIFVTGTNGKSTTTNLIAHTIASSGKTIATNKEGANMMSRSCNYLNKKFEFIWKI